ncbi:MAG: hypothetical protein DRI61_10940 [Chloroflexi bacterium]|nr:MAG: hypothetical protein DRI61_10940 [Chloroflexota bacterium]
MEWHIYGVQDWRDGFRALLTLSKAFFPYMLLKLPELVVLLLPVAVANILMDLKASKDFAVLELENGEILIPKKPRVHRILAYSLMADCLMMAILAYALSGYDSVVMVNSAIFYGLYLLETSGAKAAVEAYRPELVKEQEVFVEN